MKNLLYIIVSAFLVLSVQSCNRLTEDNGDLLNNTDANDGGMNGPRFLYQEYNSVDTLAEYHYDGLKLVEVLIDESDAAPDYAQINIEYNGDLINKITSDGRVGADSIVYNQFFNYNVSGTKLTTITETRSIWVDFLNADPLVESKFKSLYTITYNADDKIEKITMKMGQDIALQPFTYVQYSETTLTYDVEGNISQAHNEQGTITNDVFDAPVLTATYDYDAYDSARNAYSLLPMAYRLSRSIETPESYYWFSPNSPKRIMATINGTPVLNTTEFTYDPQNFVTSGYNINYDYRPF